MPINQFLPFAIDEDANVMSQADYAGLLARQSGFQMGVASSEQLNKVWRQSSIISSVLSQFICNHQTDDVLDNGEIPTLVTQLEIAIQSFLGGNSTLVVPGTTVLWCAPVVPDGYLELAGQAISRTTYSALFALFGTIYGDGNGSTTFNLPDLRGEFVRGWDHGRGIDSGRSLGSSQLATSVYMGDPNKTSGAIANIYNDLDDNPSTIRTALHGESSTAITTNIKVLSTPATTDDPTTVVNASMSVRPRNIALMYIIKT
ncbi:phage tail protein [Acinetobacter beijerinckii]|uniref:phage tail protein n=1 Tax=Acinetobacter beijerinckii TaxID=262668 RepID=UPI0030D8A5BF